MFAMIILYILFLGVRKLFTGYIKGTGEREFCDKKIVPWFEAHNIEVTCITFILEGNIDISIWTLISSIYVKRHGIGMPHFSDVFSNLFAFVMLLLLACAPVYLLFRTMKFHKINKKIKELQDRVKIREVRKAKNFYVDDNDNLKEHPALEAICDKELLK
jgi:hypothetical protein